jgi:hypothetical protein
VALCSLLARFHIQEVMLDFFILIYALSAAIVGYRLGKSLRLEPYITAQEAVKYLLVVLLPVFNTVFAWFIFWEAIDDIVIWRRKNDKA